MAVSHRVLLIDSSGSVQGYFKDKTIYGGYDKICAKLLDEYSDANVVLWATRAVPTTRATFDADFMKNGGCTIFSRALNHVDSNVTTVVVLTDGEIDPDDFAKCRQMTFNRDVTVEFYLWKQNNLSIPAACLGNVRNINVYQVNTLDPTTMLDTLCMRGDLEDAITCLEKTPIDWAVVKGHAFQFRLDPRFKRAVSKFNTTLLRKGKIYSVDEYETAPPYVRDEELHKQLTTVFNIMERNSFSSAAMSDPYDAQMTEVTSFDSFVYEDAITCMDSGCNYLMVVKPKGSNPILRDREDLLDNPLMLLLDAKMCQKVKDAVEYSVYSGDTIKRLWEQSKKSPVTRGVVTNILPLNLTEAAYAVATEIMLGRDYSRCNVLWYLLILVVLDNDFTATIKGILKNCENGGVTLNLAKSVASMDILVSVEAYLVNALRKLKTVPYVKAIDILKTVRDVSEFNDIGERVFKKYAKDNKLYVDPNTTVVDLASIDVSHKSCKCGYKKKRQREYGDQYEGVRKERVLWCRYTDLTGVPEQLERLSLESLEHFRFRATLTPVQREWKYLQQKHPEFKTLIRVLIFQYKHMAKQLPKYITQEKYDMIKKNVIENPNYYDINTEFH